MFPPFDACNPSPPFFIWFCELVSSNPMHLLHCFSRSLKEVYVHTIQALHYVAKQVGALHHIGWNG